MFAATTNGPRATSPAQCTFLSTTSTPASARSRTARCGSTAPRVIAPRSPLLTTTGSPPPSTTSRSRPRPDARPSDGAALLRPTRTLLMPTWWEVTSAGLVVGVLFGLFGVGGSSFATPVLGLLGVPPFFAVASALPAPLPSALNGAAGYLRRGEMDWRVVGLSVAGGLPMTVAGALLSTVVGGHALLVASGVVLAIVGLRVLRPI